MIKCYLIDVKNISCNLPKSNFAETDIEKLADFILEIDGLIHPLILRTIGVEQYVVIDGHLEYYAALRAKEKNLSKAEQVNAFIIPTKLEQLVIQQRDTVKVNQIPLSVERQSHDLSIATDTQISLERLVTLISSTISQQIQPITDRLNEHKKILDAIGERVNVLPIIKPPIIIDPPIIKPLIIIDPPKLNALDLINTLSLNDLVLRMSKSGVSKKAVNLAHDIVTMRNNQINNKFDNLEAIKKQVNGVGSAMIKELNEKLK